ncbi:MAG TPA: tryptophan dimethylallyltransferase family protein [Polyangiaceae bacterium]|nr:tryptophan dimethylallyltransferase family protein [Polyangiaceae bacterium]
MSARAPLWDPDASMARHGEVHARVLAEAVGHADVEGALRVYRAMAHDWGETPLADFAFRSKMTQDLTPLEFSVATSRAGARLRWALHCVDRTGRDAGAGRALGVGLCERLTAFGADLGRFRVALEELAPERAIRGVPLMVGVDFGGRGPTFKAYFRGGAVTDPERRCCAALRALGLGGQAAFLDDVFGRGPVHCFLVGLDLEPSAGARVKVYLACGPVELERSLARLVEACGEPPAKLAAIEHFADALGGRPGAIRTSLTAINSLITLQFVGGREAPAGLAFNHLLHPSLDGDGAGDDDDDDDGGALDDEAISRRLVEIFARSGLDAGAYLRALAAFARVPLRDEYLIHNFAALQGRPGAESLSVYLNPRFFGYRFGVGEG